VEGTVTFELIDGSPSRCRPEVLRTELHRSDTGRRTDQNAGVTDPAALPTIPVDAVPVPLAIVRADGTVVHANAGLCGLLSWTGDGAGRSLAEALDLGADETRHLLDPGSDLPSPSVVLVTSPIGHLELSASPIDLPDGPAVAVAVRPTAPSDDQMDQLILEAHDVLGEGVIVGDGSRVIHVNDAACRLYGYRRQELLAMESLFGLFRSDEQDRISGSLAGRSERGEPAPDRFETVIVRKGGEELDVDVSVKAVLSGDRVRTLTIIRDTTDRRRAEAELTRLAFHDPLTGLPNRLLFLDRIERSMARARRTGTRGALLYLDLDGFKAVNDTYGHPVGDLVLMAVAERISEVMREQDSGFRLGGDEFAVLVDSVGDEEHAQIMRQRVFDAIARPVQTAGGTISVTASIGLQLFGTEELTAGELLGRTDQAMFEAKRARACSRPPAVDD